MSIDKVCQFARDKCDFEEAEVAILRKNKVNGRALLLLTKHDLVEMGIPWGPAVTLLAASKQPKE